MQGAENIDVICVIHGDYYDFSYVEKLYRMVSKNLVGNFRFNVLTEEKRHVPDYMKKHALIEWPDIYGRRAAWWYKLQLFRPDLNLDQALYFDLDTVIVNDISWIRELDSRYFWSIRDFKYLWRNNYTHINSSLMYFPTDKFHQIWHDCESRDIKKLCKIYRGDQDYLTHIIDSSVLRFVEDWRAQSWRWQILDGGIDIKTRSPKYPGRGAIIPHGTSLIVCHGTPKPHEIKDAVIDRYWI